MWAPQEKSSLQSIDIYEEKTSPLVNFYEEKGILQTETVSTAVNRMGADVARDLVEKLK